MPSIDEMRSRLAEAGYNGPQDDASIQDAFARTVNGGNAGGGSSGSNGGGTGLIGGDLGLISGIANSQAATALAKAQLEYQKARLAQYEIPSMENQRKYQEAQVRLQEAQDTWNRDWTERRYGMDRGDDRQEFAVDTAMDTWDKRIRLAEQNAQNTGLYVQPEQSPNLPYSYRDDEFRRDFLSRYGRQPTNGERYWNMPEFASPSAPNPVSQAPQMNEAEQAQANQARQMAERDLGRGMSEPEFRTWLTGRFDPDHPLVLQGKYKSGDLLSKYEQDLGRPMRINQYRQYLPESVQANYGRQSGTPMPAGTDDQAVSAMAGQESNMQPWQQGLLGGQQSNPYQQRQYDPAAGSDSSRQYQAIQAQYMQAASAAQRAGASQDQLRAIQEQYRPQLESLGRQQEQLRGGQVSAYGNQGGNQGYGGGYDPNAYIRTDPITGQRATISVADRNNYYNQTGNLVTGQQGLLGRQQDLTEQQQRWLQQYQRNMALGRIDGQDTLGGRVQNLAELQGDRDWQYKQASLQSNPANAAMMEALGGRGALRTQGLLGQGGQGGTTQAADPRTVNPYSLDRLSPDESSVLDSYSRASGRTPEQYRYEAGRSRPQGQYAGRARWR